MAVPNIVAFRIDERLIHGQGQLWIKALGVNTVIVANDSASEDSMQQTLMKAVVPKTIAMRFFSIQHTCDVIMKASPKQTIFIVCKTPEDALKLVAGGVPVTVELEEKDRFRLTKEKVLEKLTPKTKILVLPFPNNPTGSILEKEDLEAIADVVREKDLFVISDEIYSELTYGRHHCTIAALPGMKERTVLINGFSKSYAMTGWRLGYACAPEAILRQMLKIHQYAIMCAPTTSQYAAVEALRNGDRDVEEMREAYDQRRRFLVKALRDMGLDCYEPQGAFYVFPCIKKFGMSSDTFALRLLEQEKVAVVPGTAFGDCGEGYLRISYAYSLQDLKRALERMGRFVTSLEEM